MRHIVITTMVLQDFCQICGNNLFTQYVCPVKICMQPKILLIHFKKSYKTKV